MRTYPRKSRHRKGPDPEKRARPPSDPCALASRLSEADLSRDSFANPGIKKWREFSTSYKLNLTVGGRAMDVDVRSLAYGERRRDRRARGRARKGTGRVTGLHAFGLVAGKSGSKRNRGKAATGMYGFADLEMLWNDLSGNEDDASESGPNPALANLSMSDFNEMDDEPTPERPSRVASARGSRKKGGRRASSAPSPDEPKALDFGDDVSGAESVSSADAKYEEGPTAPVSGRKKAKSERRRDARRKAAHRRRQTLMIVAEAQESGLADTFDEEAQGLRRSKRRRTKPLAWWEGERRSLERRKSGVGVFLPTLTSPTGKRSEHFIDEKKLETKRRRATSRRGRSRKKKKKVQEQTDSEIESVDSDFTGRAWVVEANGTRPSYVKLAVKKAMLRLSSIQNSPDEEIPAEELPKAGKWIDANDQGFSSGMLVLPPGAVKQQEVTVSTEVFYVSKGESKSLEVKVGDNGKNQTTFVLSKGDHFFIPAENVYKLCNTSK